MREHIEFFKPPTTGLSLKTSDVTTLSNVEYNTDLKLNKLKAGAKADDKSYLSLAIALANAEVVAAA